MDQVDHNAISCGTKTIRGLALFAHAVTQEPVRHPSGEIQGQRASMCLYEVQKLGWK